MTRTTPFQKSSSDVNYSPMQEMIQTFASDMADMDTFFQLSSSPTRSESIKACLVATLEALTKDVEFPRLDAEAQVDYLLLKSHITRLLRQNAAEERRLQQAQDRGWLGSWMRGCLEFIELRQKAGQQVGLKVGEVFHDAEKDIKAVLSKISLNTAMLDKEERFIMSWTIPKLQELHVALEEAVAFYRGYDPTLTWWLEQPWMVLDKTINELIIALKKKAGLDGPGSADDIVGQPIGRKALLEELQAEWIAYSPEELLDIAKKEFLWCEREMKAASVALGFVQPKDALEHVKRTFVQPGEQIHLVRDLADEAISYVVKYQLITVPKVAKDFWPMSMMSPAQQKVNPFFLGGERVIVSYPTNTMDHEDKLMSMRGNNPAFSRSTVFHELIPGHHLQFYYLTRFRPYRQLFSTPFSIEGWAVYWEFLLWQRGFPAEIGQKWATNEAANRIGMLFWRSHRCARIIFSLRFHLGQMSPQECIDLLVNRVGHERATAEGEVRRSLSGEYPPLYQAGYLLGALQLWNLREEMSSQSHSSFEEKKFHDFIMRRNTLPIELLRALMTGQKLSVDQEPRWRFYG